MFCVPLTQAQECVCFLKVSAAVKDRWNYAGTSRPLKRKTGASGDKFRIFIFCLLLKFAESVRWHDIQRRRLWGKVRDIAVKKFCFYVFFACVRGT
jgi:hypothetical protein